MFKYIFKKLVQNKLPARMESEGVVVHKKSLSKQEYIEKLKLKIIEEASEVASADNKEQLCIELSDVLDVIDAIKDAHSITEQEFLEARSAKQKANGVFDIDSYIDHIEVSEDNHQVIQYLKDKNRHYINDDNYKKLQI